MHSADRLASVEIDSGKTLWTAPIAALKSAAVSSDGKRVLAVGAAAAYAIDAESGRILVSSPLSPAEDGLTAADPSAQKLAYVDDTEKVVVLDIASGAVRSVSEVGKSASRLAWSRDSKRLLIGQSDGAVQVWDETGGARPLIASPLSGSFRASSWPGQPPQGAVLQLALSHDGRRIAVIRQDLSALDIYDLADGRQLTHLTPPWSTLQIPAQTSFAEDDAIVTAWAVHPMAREKPRFVTVHKLPRDFEEALAAANARLQGLNAAWSPDGTPIR